MPSPHVIRDGLSESAGAIQNSLYVFPISSLGVNIFQLTCNRIRRIIEITMNHIESIRKPLRQWQGSIGSYPSRSYIW